MGAAQSPDAQPPLPKARQGSSLGIVGQLVAAGRWHPAPLHLLILPRGVPRSCTRSGSGVSSALRSKSKKVSWSTGDLQALAAEAEAELCSSGSGPVVSAVGSLSWGGSNGQGLAAPPPPPAAAAAAAMRKVQSHGGLAAAVEAEIERSSSSLTRRKTLGVGEMLPLLGVEGRRRSGGGGSSTGTAAGAAGRLGASGQLGSVAEEGPNGSGSSSPAATAAAAGGMASSSGKGVPFVARSKSLSVEDALQVLASGGSLPGVADKPAAKQQQSKSTAAVASPVGPAIATAVPTGTGSCATPAAVAPAGGALPAAALPSVAGAPLTSAAVTADVRLGPSGSGSNSKQPAVETAALATTGQAHVGQATQPDSEEKGVAGKKLFWQLGKSKR